MSYLERRSDPGGERDYIDDVAIHAGQPIKAEIAGKMIRGRYEANWSGSGRRIIRAYFYFCSDDSDDQTCVELYGSTRVELDVW